jgi:hypothetical protein
VLTAILVVCCIHSPGLAQPGARPVAQVLDEVAGFMRDLVGRLSSVVAEERFRMTMRARGVPENQRIVSDFMLVRYPGSNADWQTFRDVRSVNGRSINGQAEQIQRLFLAPIGDALERAGEIGRAGEQYVPPLFNPLMALAFLQADLHSRFRFRVERPQQGQPPRTTRLEFVEVAQPSTVRAGGRNVPLQGSALIEDGTGRVLETRMRIGSSPALTTVTVRFRHDERLGVMLPDEMQASGVGARNVDWDGVATYENFRRFDVRTDESLQLPQP